MSVDEAAGCIGVIGRVGAREKGGFGRFFGGCGGGHCQLISGANLLKPGILCILVKMGDIVCL